MATAYIGLGSNLGDREGNIRASLRKLEERGVCVTRLSSFIETAPVGYTDQPYFINAVAEIETGLTPDELLSAALDVEQEMGRVRTIRWGPRVIDIDMLLYEDIEINTPDLHVPHPEMMRRRFVLQPLAEIAPDLRLPGGLTAAEALDGLVD